MMQKKLNDLLLLIFSKDKRSDIMYKISNKNTKPDI